MLARKSIQCVFLVAVLSIAAATSLAQDLSIFALEGPGQATVAIDRAKHTAYVVDLGKDGEGDQVKLEGQPLLQRLTEQKVQKLIVTCSHPHADHHGGIKALFRDPRNFISPAGKRFAEGIYVAESAMPAQNSLLTFLNAKGDALGIKGQKIDPSMPSAYSAHSRGADAVFIESIPYTAAVNAGVHGRSVVTKTILGGKHIHIDFDDADSRAIASAVAKLKESGVTEIDTFIVPHHGSADHDLEPIYTLKPKRAIISVNPANRYGHPAPEVLAELMTRLKPENVILTGSSPGERVLIRPEGIVHAPHTAAEADSYALFVFPAMARAKGGRTKSARIAFEKIWEMMFGGAESNGASSVISGEIKVNGTMLSEDFEAGAAIFGHVKPDQIKSRVFANEGLAGGALAVMAVGGAGPSGTEGRPSARRVSQVLTQVNADARIDVTVLNNIGLPDMAQAAKSYRVKDLLPPTGVTIDRAPGPRPDGGMVNLTGDKVMMTDDAKVLQASRISKCGVSLCMITNSKVYGSEKSLRLPFVLNTLTAAVWKRTYRDNIDRLYLSINPTKKMLESGSIVDSAVPGDRLYYGPDLKTEWRNNRVVTMGEIDRSVIGKILWEADVAFKSEALGFDVLTGRRPTTSAPVDITRDLDERAVSANFGLSKAVQRPERWCRLYWESGEQRINVDPALTQIRLTGRAVVARGEAMRARGGELVPYPQGTWCEDAKAVATRLEASANGPMPSSQNLKDLRNLAEMQNFWRWAREHLVTVDSDLEKDLLAHAERDVQQPVPAWTSGVRSQEPVLVQYRRTANRSFQSQMLHLRFSEPDTVDRCVLPKWQRRTEELGALGVKKDGTGKFVGTNVFAVTNQWMREFEDEIAKCASGKTLPEKVGMSKLTTDDEDEARNGEFGVTPHLQPIAIHGGVVLGRGSQTLSETITNTKALNDPWGRPLFRATSGTLHFWVTNDEPKETHLLQHLEIREAVLKEVYVRGGHVRFLVETKPGAYLRQEVRLLRPDQPNQGIEWFGVYDGQTAKPVIEKAASPCEGGANPCSLVSNMTRANLEKKVNSVDDSGLVLIHPIAAENGAWVVDLPVAYVADSLAHLLKPSSDSDIGRSASLSRAYRFWGFEDKASDQEKSLQATIREQTGTEDLIIGEKESLDKIMALLVAFKVSRLTDELKDKPPAIRLAGLESMERSIRRLPLADAYRLWKLLELECGQTDAPASAVELNRRKDVMIERCKRQTELSKLLLFGKV